MRDMFDAIAPRYDLVNRIMTFRLDVRWRRRAVRSLALPAGSRILDLASGTGDLCLDLRRRPGTGRSRSTSASACCMADRSGAPRVQADILRLPVPDALGRRRDVRVRPAQPRRPRAVLRRARPRRAPRRAHRPARRRASPTTGWSAGATASTSARSCPRIGGLAVGPGRLPLPAAQRRLPAAGRPTMLAMLRRPGSPTPPTPSSAAASPSCSAAPATADACRHPPRRRRHRRARPQRHRPGRRLPVRARRRRARRPRASPPGRRRTTMPALLAAIDHDDRTGGDATSSPGRHRLGAVRPGGARRADRPGGDGPQDGRRPPAGDGRSTTPSSACRRRTRRARRPSALHDRAGHADRPRTSPPWRRPATPCATAA